MLLAFGVFCAVRPARPQSDDLEEAALGEALDTPQEENCPSPINALWTLTATVKEMSYNVRDLKTRTAALEGTQAGLLAMDGAATVPMRNQKPSVRFGVKMWGGAQKADLVMNDDATALKKLKHGPTGHIVLAQNATVAARWTAMQGDGTLDSAGTLDLTDGAVSLDELAGLGAAVRPVQDSWGGFALCGTLF
jgi:hypothetical protein